MNSTLFEFGFIKVKWYSFFIFIGVLVALFIIIKEYKKKENSIDELTDLLFYGIIIGILGARIYYVLFNLEYYLSNPIEIIQIWNGGLAIHGGIIATLIFLFIYCKKKNVNFLLILDILVVGVIIAQSIGRWGNFFNGEAYGRIVTLNFLKNLHLPRFIINGMYIDGFYREPTFLYESVLSLLGFIVLLLIRKIKTLKVGQLTGIYFIWYGIERFIIETFRSDSLLIGNIKQAQIVSIISCIVGIYLLFKNIKSNKLYKEEKIFLEK
ncbi:MAG: prolipoprotein diacylglyceryl transferase [Bacilli bacterium]|nr:prolipoprotein diacylglyceryl transferase [Bacilli bacterium]